VFLRIELALNDTFLKKGASASSEIVIISIDDVSIDEIGQYPWDRSVHAKLINNIAEGEAAAIGIDLIFTEPSDSLEDDMEFALAIKNAGNVVMPVKAEFFGEAKTGKNKELSSKSATYPIPIFADEAFVFGHINTLTDDTDGYVRRYIPYIRNEETNKYLYSFALQLYTMYKDKGFVEEGNKKLTVNFYERPFIHYAGKPGFIETISYINALDKDIIDPEYFRDKIVLIGVSGTGISEDTYYTPASGVQPMHGIEIHANIINDLIYNDIKVPIPNTIAMLGFNKKIPVNVFNIVAISCIGFLFAIVGKKVKRLSIRGLFIAFFALVYFVAYIVLQRTVGYIIDLVYPLILLAVLFLIEMISSYIKEYIERMHITNAFGRYMAVELVDKIIKEGESSLELGGAKRDLSVMFVDIRGFTPMSELLEAEQVVEMLNEYLSMVTEKIFQNKGILDKYIGDAAMALFNVPYDLENYPLHAVKTAIEIRDTAVELNKVIIARIGRGIQFGIGIHTGNAIVGNIGSLGRMDYTAIGDTVNVAARLESNAKPGQVLISSETYELVRDYVNAEFIGNLTVKGRINGVPTYEVKDLK
jgi:adenylate cyclase